MKKLVKILFLFAALSLGAGFTAKEASAQVAVSFQVFYDNLSPYGSWVSSPDYGYVWIPAAGPDFTPYATSGHWAWTAYGWMWVSDYPWGWAPFHYGRWNYDPFYGWMWVPGTEWGPAWVCWRHSEGYYGWTPLGPGISVNVAFGNGYYVPPERWTFVQPQYMASPHVSQYYVGQSNNPGIIKNTTIVNNTYVDNSSHVTYISGPSKQEVQQKSGKQIEQVMVRNSSTPGQKVGTNEVSMYKPTVQKNAGGKTQPAPQNVTSLKQVKQVNQQKMQQAPGNNAPQNKSLPDNKTVSPDVKKTAPQQQAPQKQMPQQQKQPPKTVTPQQKQAPIPQQQPKQQMPQQQKQPPKNVAPQQQAPMPQQQPKQQQMPQQQKQPPKNIAPQQQAPHNYPQAPKQQGQPQQNKKPK